MSDERAKRWIEESKRDAIRQSAGRQHIEAAATAEQNGDMATAEREYDLAAQAFVRSASEYRESKSYKKAALFMCKAGDVYSDMASASQAVEAYQSAADDLLAAAAEHLIWGEDAETSKGTAIAVAASMIYIMIGKEADGFYKARGFNAEHASKIRLPATVRLSQIPQMLESAIQSMSLEAFASAENATVTELKAALASAGSQDFAKYVDRGLDMVREILRGKLKVPKISTQLVIPVDLTFTEDFPVRLVVKNTGEGEALNMRFEWSFDEGLEIQSGERTKSIPTLPGGDSLDVAVVVKSAESLVGKKEYAVVVRGSYADKLKTEYSLQAGPTAILLKDYKETEKLLHDADVTDGRFGLLKSSIEETPLEAEPLTRVVDGLSSSIKQSRSEVESGELGAAKARIRVVNDLIDAIDRIVGDEALLQRVRESRMAAEKEYAKGVLLPAIEEVSNVVVAQEKKLEDEASHALDEWDTEAHSKREVRASVLKLQELMGQLKRQVGPGIVPPSQIGPIEQELQQLLSNKFLEVTARPETTDKVELAQVLCRSLRTEITRLLESKKSELE
jgi:hypothetical protein